jgi:hypothetical protein
MEESHPATRNDNCSGIVPARLSTTLLQLTNIARKLEAFNHFRAFE